MPRTRTTDGNDATELESCVLAIIEQLGPCTPYAVRRYLSVSLSSYWSGSAGAIYPMLRRLAGRGWLAVDEKPFGSRVRRSYRLTDSGRRRLRRWLSAPVPGPVVAHTFDPIRARVFFLDMVSDRAKLGFLDDAIKKTTELLGAHHEGREGLPLDSSAWELHGREGAIRELEARVEWLIEVRASVEEG